MPTFHAADGVRLHYRDEGRGKPLVLVHGWMMSGAIFQPQFQALASTHRIVAPDLRGCGESQARPGTHTVPRYAQDLAQLLDHLDLQAATVVGWSMGGGITMETLNTDARARIAAVGLVDFPPRLEEDPSVADKVCHNLAKRRDTFTRDFVARMFLAPRPDLEALVAESKKCGDATACEMYRAMRPPQGAPLPRGHGLPAFLAFPMRGWFPKALEAWRTTFPRHVAPTFDASKHCPFLEEPETFNVALADFVRRFVG